LQLSQHLPPNAVSASQAEFEAAHLNDPGGGVVLDGSYGVDWIVLTTVYPWSKRELAWGPVLAKFDDDELEAMNWDSPKTMRTKQNIKFFIYFYL